MLNPKDALRTDRAALVAELQAAGAPGPLHGKSCRCPYHDDRNESASIYEGKDGGWRFTCHACQVSGDLFDLQAKRTGRPVADLLCDLHPPTYTPKTGSKNQTMKESNKKSGAGYSTPEAAAEAMDKTRDIVSKGYTRTKDYTYTTAAAAPVGLVLRYERPATEPDAAKPAKTFRQITRHPDGLWRLDGAGLDLWPLYRLPEVLADKGAGMPPILCEGEKAADALRAAGFNGTTTCGGAGKANKANLAPLAGAGVLVWPDNDPAGERHGDDLCARLAGLTPPATVRRVKVEHLPPKADAADLTPETIRAMVAEALASEPVKVAEPVKPAGGDGAGGGDWPDPRPLGEDPLPEIRLAEPLAPAWVADMVAAVSAHAQIDMAAPSMAALGILSGGVARKRFQVETANGHTEPLAFYGLFIAPPAARKSSVIKALMEPVNRLHKEARKELGVEYGAWEARQRKAERQQRNGKRKGEEDAPDMMEPPPAHGNGHFIFEDFTEAALVDGLAKCAETGLIASTEAAQLFDNAGGKFAQGKGPAFDATVLLKAYDCEAHHSRRVGRGEKTLAMPFLAIAAGVQPGALFDAMQNAAFRNRGLVGRLTFALPPSRIGTRTLDAPAIPAPVSEAWAAGILGHGRQAMREVSPPDTLVLSGEAWAHWAAYANKIEAGMRPGGELEAMQDWAGKHPGRVARMAAIGHVAEHGRQAAQGAITGERMAAAVAIGEAMLEHAKRLLLGRSHNVKTAELILAKAPKLADGITAHEIAARDWAGLTDTAAVERGLYALAEFGWVRALPAPASIGRPTIRWAFHPQARP